MPAHGDDREGLREQIAATVGWLVRRRSVPREIAEDAVQEALLQLLELTTARRPSHVRAWLRTVAERRLLDSERHRSTQPEAIAGRHSIDETVELNIEDLLALRQALRTLDPEARTIVILRYTDTPWDEIANTIGISAEAARKRCERAIADLRTRMNEH